MANFWDMAFTFVLEDLNLETDQHATVKGSQAMQLSERTSSLTLGMQRS